MPTPRLLLFGTPGSGKSSLLGALAQAAPALKAELIDESGGLQQLQKKTYEASLRPTVELESYQIKVQPTEKGVEPLLSKVTVLDCSGQSAFEMLQAKEPFAQSQPLKKPILDADAVLLVVDASLSSKELTAEFKQFAHWLKQLTEFRGKRIDIAELPVYFVLTKCDLLAKIDETSSTWENRVQELKGRFDENFRKYLKQHAPGFGTIKLQLGATSIQRPAFTDKPGSQEPFGVAELFRECLRSASDFQERRQTSQGRLQNILVGLAGLVALLGLALVFLGEFQPPAKGTTLDERVQMVLPKPTATPGERLQGTIKKLEERHKKLTEIESDPGYEHLPTETQEAATQYRQELAQFLLLTQEAAKLKLPYFAKNDAEFKELEKSVLAFSLPPARAKDWEETRLGRTVQHLRKEYESLHAEIGKEDAWIREQIQDNKKLLEAGSRLYVKLLAQEKDAPQQAKEWMQQYRAQLTAQPPTPREENVIGLSRLRYEDLSRFEPVKSAQKAWKTSKDELTEIFRLIQKKSRAS